MYLPSNPTPHTSITQTQMSTHTHSHVCDRVNTHSVARHTHANTERCITPHKSSLL